MSADRLEKAKALLARLVAFDSVSDRSNLPVIAFVEERLASHGVAARRAPNASGEKAAILATIGPRVDGGVVLSGHTDVVPVDGQPWSTPPFALREGGGRYRRPSPSARSDRPTLAPYRPDQSRRHSRACQAGERRPRRVRQPAGGGDKLGESRAIATLQQFDDLSDLGSAARRRRAQGVVAIWLVNGCYWV